MSGLNKGPVERSGERLDYPDSGKKFHPQYGGRFKEIADAGAPPKPDNSVLVTTEFDTSPEQPAPAPHEGEL